MTSARLSNLASSSERLLDDHRFRALLPDDEWGRLPLAVWRRFSKRLAGGKTVIVASTRGGMYSTSEGGQAMEHQESYLKVLFGFFGITDVRIVRAEGVAMGDAARAAALAAARNDIGSVTGNAANQEKAALAA